MTRAPLPGRSPPAGSGGARSAVLHAGFLLTGVATVLLGPAIPELAGLWEVAPGDLAPLFVAQFLASSVGAILSSLHLERSLIGGYVAMAAGLAGLAVGGGHLALPAAASLGLGLGLTIPATNLTIARDQPGRRGAALSTLNLLWGVGAVACPLAFAALRGRLPVTALLGLFALATLAAAFAVATVGVATVGGATVGGPAPSGGTPGELDRDPGLSVAPRTSTLALFAAMLFLYVGAESTVGGWLVAVSDQLGGATAASMIVGAGYWAALLGGRAAAPWLLRRLRERTLHGVSLGLAAAGALTIAFAEGRSTAAAGALVCGLGLASIFPLTVSLLTAETAGTGSRRAGWVFAFGGAGGATLPWLAARLADEGALQRGFFVPVAALLLLGLLLAAHRPRAYPGAERRGGALVESPPTSQRLP